MISNTYIIVFALSLLLQDVTIVTEARRDAFKNILTKVEQILLPQHTL